MLEGLAEAELYPELRPIKVNCVVMAGTNDGEVVDFAGLARETGYDVRFIEYMPLDADHAWKPSSVLRGEEIRQVIETK